MSNDDLEQFENNNRFTIHDDSKNSQSIDNSDNAANKAVDRDDLNKEDNSDVEQYDTTFKFVEEDHQNTVLRNDNEMDNNSDQEALNQEKYLESN